MRSKYRTDWSESDYTLDAPEREAVADVLLATGLDRGTVDHLTDRDGSVVGESLTPWWEQ